MAFVRFSRRRHFTIWKLFLISFAFLGVILWIYIKSTSINSALIPKPSKHSYYSKEVRDQSGLVDQPSSKALESNNKPINRDSPFRNPDLLYKLRPKSNAVKGKKFLQSKFAQHYNFTIPQLHVTPGLGENGVPVSLPKNEQVLADKVFNDAAFNVYLSDRISLNRSVPDSRNPKCEYESYESELPSASVVIIFTDEIWSALLRTIYSVINRTPSNYLKEIVLVDDFSTKAELKYYLKAFIAENFKRNFIKLIRFNERKGLIKARLAGARIATGDVLIFLDSHCEANYQWIEPLLQRIKEKRDAVVCPIIDVIDDRTFEYYASNLDYFQIGGFTWNGHFTWNEIPPREEKRRKSETGATRTPTMAGGLFAIDREYFWEIGSYDSGMEIWGGENLEMSFRIWMCGGTLEIVPCSHVGHVFRSFHPYKFPGNKDTHGINTVRTVEVWMDDYKKFFYYHRPDLKEVKYGDISDRMLFKKQMQCKSFQWYLDEIYPEKFIFNKDVAAYGTVRNPMTRLCLDTLNRDEDRAEPLGYYYCKTQSDIVINQLISFTNKGELRVEDNCAEVNDNEYGKTELPVIMTKCHGKGGNQKWVHKKGGALYHKMSEKCLDVRKREPEEDAVVKDCSGGHFQIWWFENYTHDPKVVIRESI